MEYCYFSPTASNKNFHKRYKLNQSNDAPYANLLLGTCIYGIQLALQQVFIALGQAKVSIFIAVFRKMILLIPLVFILPTFISPKTDAVIIAEPISDFCAALTCCVLFSLKIKSY